MTLPKILIKRPQGEAFEAFRKDNLNADFNFEMRRKLA
ncbi:MAG: hypothetical protein Ct9H300mP16_10310 [Pseudomonadota bacterium]|nr:MAG: hypothetical protein Ct9H300mP16_10310 [Pseudomonadota bacterium]